jgi:hypothetical protein
MKSNNLVLLLATKCPKEKLPVPDRLEAFIFWNDTKLPSLNR